ncbi:MAG: hypothetical protein JNK37_10330 [Verrucomicrobiales bacterium]|nr:hypothetical protein [Verrucomicrobiales bacterium]
MKRGLVVLAGSILLAVIGFLSSRSLPVPRTVHGGMPHQAGAHFPELEWLRREFDLSETEFERVSSLHLAYLPTCEALCEKIAAARGRLRALVIEGSSITPELESALREEATLRAECQVAMLRHLYVTAGALPPEKADAYLESMLPAVLEMTSEPTHHHRGH